MNNLNDLLSQIGEILNKADAEQKKAEEHGDNFNIFNILNLSSNEIAHSAFIAELLNPHGSHGFNDHFLCSFLQTVCPDFTLDTSSAYVCTEYFIDKLDAKGTTGGRIDILIKDAKNNALIIENKIYATDQPLQLKRYENFAKQQGYNYKILYLTLKGDLPSDDSSDHDKVEYTPISYRHQILEWLDKCIRESYEKPPIQTLLKQYKFTLKNLLNLMDHTFQDEFINICISQEHLSATLNILKNQEEIGTRIRYNFIQELKKLAEHKGLSVKEENNLCNKIDDSWIILYDSKQSPNWGICIGAERFNKAGGVYYGVGSIENITPKIKKRQITNFPHIFLEGEKDTCFPFGWAYLRDKYKTPDGTWWNWDSPSTLEDMANGKILDFIEHEIIDVVQKNHLLRMAEDLSSK